MKNKGIYKRLLTLSTTLTLMMSAEACNIKEEDTTFDTIEGTRNLEDYKDFLQEKGINYRDCHAEAQDNKVFIFEKVDSTYIVRDIDTFQSILELYPMTKKELLDLNFKNEDYQLVPGEKLKTYYYKMYTFTLEELDESSEYEYYYVLPGDDLLSIAQYYDTTVEEIQRLNDIQDPNLIQIGQSIKIKKNSLENTLTK